MNLQDCSPNLADVSRDQLEQWYLFNTAVLIFILKMDGPRTIHPSDADAVNVYRRIYIDHHEDDSITVGTQIIDVAK